MHLLHLSGAHSLLRDIHGCHNNVCLGCIRHSQGVVYSLFRVLMFANILLKVYLLHAQGLNVVFRVFIHLMSEFFASIISRQYLKVSSYQLATLTKSGN